MKTNRNAIKRQSESKKKKAFSISSCDLADAVADYVAKGGEINQIKNPFKREETNRFANPNKETA